MFAATGGGGLGGGSRRFAKGIMEQRVIHYLRAVSGDKSLFRQWHQKFTIALGQVACAHGEMVHRLVEKIDLGRGMEKVLTGLRGEYGDGFDKVSGENLEHPG